MATVTTIFEESPHLPGAAVPRAVSWPAILAGATVAAALSLILVVLGVGLGLSALSPWTEDGTAAAEAIGWGAIIWIVFAAFASSALGGYIAGRLRDSWQGVHGDEVYFRDTAHGLLAWAVATLFTAAVLASSIAVVLKAAVPAAAVAGATALPATGTVRGENQNDWNYAVDSLFRNAGTAPGATPQVIMPAVDDTRIRTEIGHVFDTSQTAGAISPDDVRYVGQILAQYRGFSQPDAEQRVLDTFNAAMTRREQMEQKTRQLAEQASRNATHASMWIFISLLLGAFSASLMATFGGRRRDLP